MFCNKIEKTINIPVSLLINRNARLMMVMLDQKLKNIKQRHQQR